MIKPEHNCPACPVEVRNLYAVAQNLVRLVNDHGSWCKITDKVRELKEAADMVEPLVKAHFAASDGEDYGDVSDHVKRGL